MVETTGPLSSAALRRTVAAAMVVVAVFFVVRPGSGQEPPATEPSPVPTPIPAPTAIPAAEISDQAASTAAMLRTATKANDVLEEVAAIEDVSENERQHVDELAKETSRRLEIDGPASVLEETQKTWKRIEVWLDEWQKTLKDRAGAIDSLLLEIDQQRATWQDAEVIVPNANLISSEVINWTLSDDSHRIEVSVGVAYGTEPRTVLDLLTSVARTHPDVFEDPEPIALFLGFGDSSIDFELRAWTGPDFVRVASEMRVAVYEALADAAIEIPFSQRELHRRTTDNGRRHRI